MRAETEEVINFLPLNEVKKRTGSSKTAIYKMIQEGSFPKPVKLGAHSVWPDTHIREWQRAKMAE